MHLDTDANQLRAAALTAAATLDETARAAHDAQRGFDHALVELADHLHDDDAAAAAISVPAGWIPAARYREKIRKKVQ